MTISVLVAAPSDRKLLVDLVVAARRAHGLHPELELDILVPAPIVPTWLAEDQGWLRLRTQIGALAPHYDLVIQTHADQALAQELANVSTEARSGVVTSPTFQVQGRWAQTFLALQGARRFLPFSPVDLYEHILLGRLSRVSYPSAPAQGEWVVDLDSFAEAQRPWAEEALRALAALYPGKTKDRWTTSSSPVAGYVGADPALASWLSALGAKCFLVWDFVWESKYAPANPSAWVLSTTQLPSGSELLTLLKTCDLTRGPHFRMTDEYLGGSVRAWPSTQTVADPVDVLGFVNYVVLNYVNDLCEVDIPIPRIDANCCLRLKSCQLVLRKISELNLFAIKFLNDFVTKVGDGSVTNDDVRALTEKINEVDELAAKSLEAFPELDLLRLWAHFLKAAASGESTLEIAKSLILVYHEISQALDASNELLLKITKRYSDASPSPKDTTWK